MKSRHAFRPGAALVIVIVLVSMLMVLIVAFFSLSRIERRASRAYAQTVTSDVLSESALNTVIAQIRDATSDLGTTESWASQPGMLRRYDDNGQLIGAYKLYSSNEMVEGSSFDPADELPPADWQSKPGLWVDLNAPVVFDRDGDGEPDDEDGDGEDDASYPIVHRAAVDEIDGFDVERAPGAYDNQPIPMPVRWLYMLQDGTLATASDGSGGTTVKVPAAKTDNPVVGRLAFWADDECSKVNINTASEGTFWDIPRTNSTFERTYSNSQPVQGEFQRYTGHPSMTCLSPVLGEWLGDPDTESNATRRNRILGNYYKLTPRIVQGGSMGGTVIVTDRTRPIDFSRDQDRLYSSVDEYVFDAQKVSGDIRSANQGMAIRGGGDTVRDVVEKTRFFLTSRSQAPEVNLFNQPRLALWPIQAEETDRNLVDDLIAFCASTGDDSSTRTPYYFQRATTHSLRSSTGFGSSQSTTQDWNIGRNQDLYGYMQDLMARPVPGYGASFKGKFQGDSDQILTQMVDYLRSGLNTYSLNRDRSKSYYYAPPRKMGSNRGARGEAQIVPLHIDDTKGFGRFVTVTEAALVIYPADTISTWNSAKYSSREFKPRTPAGQKKGFHCEFVRAFLLLEFYCPSVGLPSWSPYVDIQIEGLDAFEIEGTSLNMPASATVRSHTPIGLGPGRSGDAPEVGGGNITAHFGIFQPLYTGDYQKSPTVRDPRKTDQESGYAFHSSAPVKLPGAVPAKDARPGSLNLSSGDLTITLKSPVTGEVVQTINMEFPSCTMPRPYIYAQNGTGRIAERYETDLQQRFAKRAENFHWALIRPGDVVRSMEPDRNAAPKGDLRFHAAVQDVPAEWFTTGGMVDNRSGRRSQVPSVRTRQYFDADEIMGRFAHGLRQNNSWQFFGQFCAMPANEHGLDAIRGNYQEHPFFRMAAMRTAGALVKGHHLYTEGGDSGDTARSPAVYRDAHFVCARDLEGAYRADGQPGDFDSGFGHTEDGCYINKPDEGNSYGRPFDWSGGDRIGGYNNRGHYDPDERGINHVPNRQIASAVQMGSLPTGIMRNKPWQTLLFNPVPSGPDHPGEAIPKEGYPKSTLPDHLLLDWWWMPVAQPYPISQPMATSGKININYQILPFSYIKRRTPIHSLMKAVRIGAIPFEAASRRLMETNYRQGTDAPLPYETRFMIKYKPARAGDDHGTLEHFEEKFDRGEIFRSASEICEIPLVPQGIPRSRYWKGMERRARWSSMENWWKTYASLTGDNMRETPYNHIYPRCTTKSNTFRVHMHVQRITPTGSDPAEIDLNTAQIAGDWRGSILIERFVDPNDPSLPDFANEKDKSLDDFYRVRILERKEFRPQ